MSEKALTGRYSVHPETFAGDRPPNYGTDHFGVRVFLDGTELEKVIGFDTASGEVCCVCIDDEGQPIIDRETEEWRTETLKGDVTALMKVSEE